MTSVKLAWAWLIFLGIGMLSTAFITNWIATLTTLGIALIIIITTASFVTVSVHYDNKHDPGTKEW